MIGWWLLAGCVCAVLLSCVPLTVRFDFRSSPSWRGQLELAWGGALRIRRAVPAERSPASPPQSGRAGKRARRAKPRARSRGKRSSPPPGLILEAVRHGTRFAGRLVRQTRVEELVVDCQAGLEDPADTGMLCAWLAPVVSTLNASEQSVLHFQPDFLEESFTLQSRGRATFVPALYLWIVLLFVINPKTWRIGAQLARP